MRNSIDNLVLNSANGIEQRMIDCTVIQMYNDMLKEKFDYTPSTSGMVMEESESDENPTEGNEQTTNADGGVLNDDKLVDSSESVVDMVDNKNQEVVVQVKMNHKSDINEEIEKGLDINNQENTQYNNESDEAIGKEYEENTLVEDIDEINNDLPAAGDFDDLGEYDYADIGSDLDDTEFIDDDSDIKQTRDERQRHAEKDGKRLLPVGVCYAFGCALTDVFSNYHDADNDMERENIPKTDTGVLVQGTENQDNTNLKMETRRYSVSSDTHKVLDNELAHNENDVDPSDENDKGNDLHDVDIEGDRTFLNDNKEETSNKENDILNEEEIKPSFSPTSDSNLNYDQPFDSTLLPNPDEQNGIDVNKEMLQEDGHLDSKINNEKNSVQLEQIKEKILNIEGYDVKHSTQRDESKSAFDSVNVEKMIEEKTNNYFKKLQSIEILIMKLENQLLLESLNKQNHSSTITRLENHILRLENELLKMSKTYHDLKEEAEHLSQRQNKYLELAYKEQAKKSASEIADKSDKSLELISHHQSRIKELAEVLENPAVPGVHDSKNDNNSEMSDTSNEINDQVENQRYGSEFSDKSYAKTGNGIEDGENDITNSVDNAMALDKSNDRDQIQPNDSKFPDKPDVKTETDIKDDENDIIDVVSNTIAPDKGNYQDQDQPNDSDFPDKSDFITKYGIKGDENDKNDIVGNTITPVKTDDRDQIQSDSEFQDKSDVKIKTENKGDEKAKNDIVGNTITPVKTDDRDQIQSDSEFQDKPDIKTKNHENDKIDVLGNNIASPSEPSHRNKEAQSIDTPEGTNDVSGLRYGKNKPENEHTSSSSSREKNADTDSITGGAKIDIASIDNADLLNELQKYKFVGYDKEGKPVFRLKEEAKQLKDTIIHAAEGKLLNGKENDKAKFESINENSVVQQAETNRVNDENSNGSREAETNLTKNTKTDAGQDESKQGSSQDKIDMTMNQIDTSAQDNVRIVKNRANTNEIAEETDKQVTNENEKVSRDESTQGQNEEKLPKKIDTPGTNDESQDDSKQGSLEKELTQETHKQEAFSQPEKLGEQVYEQKKTLDKTVEEKPLKHEEDKENVLTDQKNETIDAKTVAEDEQKADVKSEMKSTVSEEKDKAIKREEEKQQGKQSDKTEKMQQSEKQEKTKDKEDDSTLNKDKSKGQTGTNDTKDGRTERKKPIHIDLEKSGDSKDCYDFYVRGNRRDGLYKVRPTGIEKQVEVFCDMRRGGWTVIQRRQDGTTNFFQTWEEYKNGFGGLYGEHWLGNDNIHYLTNQDYYQLRVDLMDWDKNKKYAEFDFFLVDNEDYGYTVHVEGYTGDAGDGLTKHDGSKFSTKDVDNDKVVKEFGGSCAKRFHGAGWYYKCYASNLNGKFYKGGKIPEKRFDGVTWKPWTGPNYSLKKVEMKIRPLSAKD
ncbi:FBCDB-like protein [Mya arenaria]|uniref:FBCDB-like protein n=1 Tax=Mya arenaria TaxID=6604 RepID=A0ABY7FIY2_MYAAR|nr:FBCDB-like protein [Mya arenaria]